MILWTPGRNERRTKQNRRAGQSHEKESSPVQVALSMQSSEGSSISRTARPMVRCLGRPPAKLRIQGQFAFYA